MKRIHFLTYLICFIFSVNTLSTYPSSAATSSSSLSTHSNLTTVIQIPINSNLTNDNIIYHNQNQYHHHHNHSNGNSKKPQYHHNNHQHQYHHHQHQQLNLGYLIGNCLTKPNISYCVIKLAIDTIEMAIKDNHTWNINPYISIIPNSDWHPKLVPNNIKNIKQSRNIIGNSSINHHSENDLNDILLNKIKNFAESRSISVTLIPKQSSEARSKKSGGKDKGGAMVGVMVMIGVMAQMFMGKVLMLAGGAFLISKLALLFSILSGLKKSGGGSDHVIYTESSGGGGSGHGGGWNRQLDAPAFHGDIIQRKNFL